MNIWEFATWLSNPCRKGRDGYTDFTRRRNLGVGINSSTFYLLIVLKKHILKTLFHSFIRVSKSAEHFGLYPLAALAESPNCTPNLNASPNLVNPKCPINP